MRGKLGCTHLCMGLRLNHSGLRSDRRWQFEHLGLGHWNLIVRLNIVAPLASMMSSLFLLQGDISRGIRVLISGQNMVRIEIVSTGVHLVLHVQGGASKTKAHDEDPNAGSGNAWDWIYSRTAFVSGSTLKK